VTDFTFATSDHYIWKSTSVEVDKKTKRRTRVDAVYNPDHADFKDVIHMGGKTVEAMSYYYPKWPFPYNTATVFEGLAEMEYPMMANIHQSKDTFYTAALTIHEIFHTMFPFYMGINEIKYAWMDEGWATVGEWLLYAHMYPGEINNWGVDQVELSAGNETDFPIMTLSAQLPSNNYYVSSYFKPALGFSYLQEMLGDDRFFKGLHYYIKNWNGKHPIPWDLFNSMNFGTGVNMDWFWKAWFFDAGYPDLSIENVSQFESHTEVIVRMKGSKPVPVNLTATFADNSTFTIHKNISIWERGNKEIVIVLTSGKEVTNLLLDGTHIPDVNKEDNVWTSPAKVNGKSGYAALLYL
jgi:hypothetical protein